MRCDCELRQEYREPDVEPRVKAGLVEIKSPDGYSVLYRCKYCDEYWEKYHPWAESHGAGPSRLHRINVEQAEVKYGI